MAHGFNDRFQLGLGDRRIRSEPTLIPALEGVRPTSSTRCTGDAP